MLDIKKSSGIPLLVSVCGLDGLSPYLPTDVPAARQELSELLASIFNRDAEKLPQNSLNSTVQHNCKSKEHFPLIHGDCGCAADIDCFPYAYSGFTGATCNITTGACTCPSASTRIAGSGQCTYGLDSASQSAMACVEPAPVCLFDVFDSYEVSAFRAPCLTHRFLIPQQLHQ
eukprot:TRINITY_DN6373_c0_g1_i1.p1 TRINITY_DN6373_c0_g1~~TRINITY_DN6373_c0_g1_i1.p1  ORF type:complete len:173 (-),score=28.39 TRINITY_DN6373_c0_g1_i1:10-528(-)